MPICVLCQRRKDYEDAMVNHYKSAHTHLYLRNHYCGRCFNFFENVASFCQLEEEEVIEEVAEEIEEGANVAEEGQQDPPLSVKKAASVSVGKKDAAEKKGEEEVQADPLLAAKKKGEEEVQAGEERKLEASKKRHGELAELLRKGHRKKTVTTMLKGVLPRGQRY